MKQYIRTEVIMAVPAVRLEDGNGNVRVELLSSNPMPLPGDIVDMGYKVVHPDGYESWYPQDAFNEAYHQTDGMNFGLAIESAKLGKRIARKWWNGRGMYVFLADNVEFHTDADISEFQGSADGVYVADMLVMRTAQGNLQPGWLASQADLLADDWCVVE